VVGKTWAVNPETLGENKWGCRKARNGIVATSKKGTRKGYHVTDVGKKDPTGHPLSKNLRLKCNHEKNGPWPNQQGKKKK